MFPFRSRERRYFMMIMSKVMRPSLAFSVLVNLPKAIRNIKPVNTPSASLRSIWTKTSCSICKIDFHLDSCGNLIPKVICSSQEPCQEMTACSQGNLPVLKETCQGNKRCCCTAFQMRYKFCMSRCKIWRKDAQFVLLSLCLHIWPLSSISRSREPSRNLS